MKLDSLLQIALLFITCYLRACIVHNGNMYMFLDSKTTHFSLQQYVSWMGLRENIYHHHPPIPPLLLFHQCLQQMPFNTPFGFCFYIPAVRRQYFICSHSEQQHWKAIKSINKTILNLLLCMYAQQRGWLAPRSKGNIVNLKNPFICRF